MPAARPDPQRLFKPIAERERWALAVSGGSDSMALMHLACEWAAGHGVQLTVLTVDHGLRPEAAAEALQVEAWAAPMNLPHVTLHWHPPQPLTGLQAKARAARYDLMSAWCEANGVPVLLTAHTLEDQAETVLMRLARTSSLDSLAGIHSFSRWNGIEIFRPLLGEKREALRAYLASLGQSWIDDPSNDDERFERVRIRKAMPILRDLGITAEGLADLAWRAAETTNALWGATDDWVKLHVVEHETGHCTVTCANFGDQTEMLMVYILGWLISRHGSGKMPEPGELELVSGWLATGATGRRTLGGAVIARRKDELMIGREAGRIDPAPVVVPESGRLLWDGRFEVMAAPGSRVIPVLCAGPLPRRKDIPAFVQASLPAIVRQGRPVAVPHLAAVSGVEARFRLLPESHLSVVQNRV